MITVTNVSKTAKHEVAEVKDVYRPNLLINGDFQVNQREQSEYIGEWKHSLDMWFLGGKITLTILSDGWIRLTNTDTVGAHAFTQRLKYAGLSESEPHVFQIECRNVKGNVKAFSENGGKHPSLPTDIVYGVLQNGLNVYTLNNTSQNKIGVSIGVWLDKNSSIELNFMSLTEGTVAYPHIKEDSALAISRCREYLRYINLIGNQYALLSSGKEAWVMFQFDNYAGMKTTPTLSTKKVGIVNISGGGTIILGPTVTPWRTGGTSKVKVNDPNPTVKFFDNMHYPVYLDAFLSCEPL